MSKEIERLLGFALTLLSTVFFLQSFKLPGWETPATIAGLIVLFVFTVIIAGTWKQPIFDSFVLSCFITGLIWLFIFAPFGLILLAIFGLGLILALW